MYLYGITVNLTHNYRIVGQANQNKIQEELFIVFSLDMLQVAHHYREKKHIPFGSINLEIAGFDNSCIKPHFVTKYLSFS